MSRHHPYEAASIKTIVSGLAAIMVVASVAEGETPEGLEVFESKIQPTFSANC